MSSPNPYAIDADTLSGMKPLRKVVYSVGSNLGDRLGNLQGAVDAISDTPDIIVVDVSSVYETDPVGVAGDHPQFLNLVIVAETTLEPRTLLERAQAIEDAFGRERDGERWGPRTLDVDLILVGNATVDKPDAAFVYCPVGALSGDEDVDASNPNSERLWITQDLASAPMVRAAGN